MIKKIFEKLSFTDMQMRKYTYLIYAFCLLSLSSYEQDKIYLESGLKEGKVFEINEEKIKYSNPLNPGPVYSVSRNKTKLLFNSQGIFLVIGKLDPTSQQSAELINRFINYNSSIKPEGDKIITLLKKELKCDILKEDDNAVYININEVELKIEKNTIAAILYKNGQHKVFGDIEAVADILYTFQEKYLPPVSKPAISSMTNSSINKSLIPATKNEVALPGFANLIITANKQSALQIYLNDSIIGELPPATSKKIPLKMGVTTIKLDDREGNKTSRSFSIEEKDLGKELLFPFPEFDYAAMRMKEQRRQKASADSILLANNRQIQKNKENVLAAKIKTQQAEKLRLDSIVSLQQKELQLKKEEELSLLALKARQQRMEKAQADSIALYNTRELLKKKEEELALKTAQKQIEKAKSDSLIASKAKELQLKKEEDIALKKAKLDSFKTSLENMETRLNELIVRKNALETLLTYIKSGEASLDEKFLNDYTDFTSLKTGYYALKKKTMDSVNGLLFRSLRDEFIKKVTSKESLISESIGEFIRNAQTGKKPLSDNLVIALQKSRIPDLSFFIPQDSINEKKIDGDYLLIYALKNKLDTSVIRYLISNGIDVDYFGMRFPDNPIVYQTPLVLAAFNGNPDIVRILVGAKASFYPGSTDKKQKREIIKYLAPRIKNPKIITLLKENNYDLNDGSEEIKEALAEIEKNMVLVDSGTFVMGCTEDQKNACVTSEKPAITVSVRSFYLNKFEVSRKIWLAIMEGDDPGEFKDCADCPIERITYDTAMAFIRKLNKISGKNFRLPTEAEWEFAARGGASPKKTYLYSGSDTPEEVAVTKENSAGKPDKIGQKKPNDLLIFDMSGNVNEWCSDWYSENYFNNDPKPGGPKTGFQKVVRGGSWNLSNWSARVSRRVGVEPGFMNNGIGFRIALSAAAETR